jgi:hypothetical protein
MPAIIERMKSAFQLAGDQQVPLFITFEDSQLGDHALHAPLQPLRPAHAQDFVKTTFAATGLPAFANAVQKAGLSHLVVMGAETDVCVLQTVLGLRAMGLTVMLEADAVFSEETNPSPALRRMQQAGVLLVTRRMWRVTSPIEQLPRATTVQSDRKPLNVAWCSPISPSPRSPAVPIL